MIKSDLQYFSLIDEADSAFFKESVLTPYFRDIHTYLAQRSDRKSRGINRVTFIDYTQLPCLIAERLFAVFDTGNTCYITQ